MSINQTIDEKKEYTTTDISMLIAGIAAAIVSIVYSLKHVKKSSCCGSSCIQTVDEVEQVVVLESPNQIENQETNNILKNSIV
jgi:NAD(P)H-nitrite reductase large subunit